MVRSVTGWPRKPSESKGRERRLSAGEWKAFEKECRASRNPWLWPAAQLAVETAMRQRELLTLTWSQIDRKNRLAMLDDPEKIKHGAPRAVPLSPRGAVTPRRARRFQRLGTGRRQRPQDDPDAQALHASPGGEAGRQVGESAGIATVADCKTTLYNLA